MSAIVTIVLLGHPRGQGRPRFVKATGIAHKDAKTQHYEDNLAVMSTRAMAGRKPLEGPLATFILAVFPIPKSWPAKKKAAALIGQIRPTVKPDWDNIGKMTDAMKGIVFVDDAHIVDGRVKKVYGDRPRLVVTVAPVEELRKNAPTDAFIQAEASPPASPGGSDLFG